MPNKNGIFWIAHNFKDRGKFKLLFLMRFYGVVQLAQIFPI